MRVAVAIAVALSAAACDTTGPVTCTSMPLPGVITEIYDSVTGAPMAEGARGLVVDGAYQDSLVLYEGNADGVFFSRGAAFDRVGSYTVFVTHPGYRLWSTTDVRVRKDDCHAISQRVRVDLVPDAP